MLLRQEHHDTLTSMNKLAGVLPARERFSKANALYQRALHDYGRTLAPDHPTTEAWRRHYSRMLKEMQEDAEGKDILFHGLR